MWTWMRHAVTGGIGRYPTTVVEAMAHNGWEPCAEPANDESHLFAAETPGGMSPDVASPDDESVDPSTPAPAVGQQPANPPSRARRASTQE